AASSVLDFARLRGRSADAGQFLRLSRGMTLFWGLVLMGFGFVKWGPLLEAGLTVASLPFGSLLGLFLLGTFDRGANARGALAGMIVGLAAILCIFGAFSFAELGSMIPEAGGEYAYLRRGFGPVYGFIFGWMHSIVGRPSSLASISAGMMRFLSFLLPVIAVPLFTVHIAIPGLTGWIKPYNFVFTWAQPLAVVWLLIMTGINYLGVRLGGAVQVFLTTIKITSVVIVIGV